jgi:RHS repeat-associated protein
VEGREPYGSPVRAASFGDLHYRYGAAGNVIERTTKAGTQRLYWDCANRLVRARGTDHIPIWFGCDAQGRRLTKTRQGKTTRFGWDGDAQMAEHDGSGWRECIYEPGGLTPLVLADGGKVYHYETDQVGCPHELLDGDGAVVWSAEYDAWGGVSRLVEVRVRNPLRLQGQYWDGELVVAYNRYRYYDPGSGGFLSQDPLGITAGKNLYALILNALTWIDPLGLTATPPPTNGGTPNLPSTLRRTTQGEEFIRYENGHPKVTKITETGGVKPNTYAAPASEGVLPVDQLPSRYNLPDPELPRGRYTVIKPPAGTFVEGPKPVMGGTGTEVVFPFGAPPGSAGLPKPTPKTP